MTMTVDQAKEIVDLRHTVLANISAGRPMEHGIPREKLREAIELLRRNRATASASKTASKPGPKEPSMTLDDLASMFTSEPK